MKKILTILVIIAAVLFLAGSFSFEDAIVRHTMTVTPIGNLLDNPQNYTNESVYIKGMVTESSGVGCFSVIGLDDDTGSICVICTDYTAPALGNILAIQGKVVQIFRINNKACVFFKKTKAKELKN